MRLAFLPCLALLAALGCLKPHVVPTTQAKDFLLANLREQRVAVFPIASADLDESASATVAEEYKSKNAFLDALSLKFSGRVVSVCKEPSLASDKVLAVLTNADNTKPLLDPSKILGSVDPNNRFAEAVLPPGVTTLSQLPALNGIRYLLIARDLNVGRQWTTSGGVGGGFVSAGPGGGMFVGGGSSSSAKTSARLRLAILDLETKTVAWDGAIFAEASSTFMKATALHEIEDDLAAHFVNEVLGIK
jgi:hypothetical protein